MNSSLSAKGCLIIRICVKIYIFLRIVKMNKFGTRWEVTLTTLNDS